MDNPNADKRENRRRCPLLPARFMVKSRHDEENRYIKTSDFKAKYSDKVKTENSKQADAGSPDQVKPDHRNLFKNLILENDTSKMNRSTSPKIHPLAVKVNPSFLPNQANGKDFCENKKLNDDDNVDLSPGAEKVDLNKAATSLGEDVVQNYPVVTKSVSKLQELNKDTFKDNETMAARRVVNFLHNLWKKHSFVDVKIRTADSDIYAHRVILAAYSKVLLNMFTQQNQNSMTDLDLYDVSSTDCIEVMSFLYTADIFLTDKNIRGILCSSLRLDIQILVKICVHYLSQFSIDNVFSYLAICKDNNLLLLAASIWRYICENFEAVCFRSEYEKCTIQEVAALLSDDRIKVSSEMAVLNTAIHWLQKNSDCHANVWDVLDCVRFPLLKPEQLPQLESHPYLSTIPDVFTKLYRAVCFHSLRDTGSAMAKEYAAKPRMGPMDHLFPDVPKTGTTGKTSVGQINYSSMLECTDSPVSPHDMLSEGHDRYSAQAGHKSDQKISCDSDFHLRIPSLTSVLKVDMENNSDIQEKLMPIVKSPGNRSLGKPLNLSSSDEVITVANKPIVQEGKLHKSCQCKKGSNRYGEMARNAFSEESPKAIKKFGNMVYQNTGHLVSKFTSEPLGKRAERSNVKRASHPKSYTDTYLSNTLNAKSGGDGFYQPDFTNSVRMESRGIQANMELEYREAQVQKPESLKGFYNNDAQFLAQDGLASNGYNAEIETIKEQQAGDQNFINKAAARYSGTTIPDKPSCKSSVRINLAVPERDQDVDLKYSKMEIRKKEKKAFIIPDVDSTEMMNNAYSKTVNSAPVVCYKSSDVPEFSFSDGYFERRRKKKKGKSSKVVGSKLLTRCSGNCARQFSTKGIQEPNNEFVKSRISSGSDKIKGKRHEEKVQKEMPSASGVKLQSPMNLTVYSKKYKERAFLDKQHYISPCYSTEIEDMEDLTNTVCDRFDQTLSMDEQRELDGSDSDASNYVTARTDLVPNCSESSDASTQEAVPDETSTDAEIPQSPENDDSFEQERNPSTEVTEAYIPAKFSKDTEVLGEYSEDDTSDAKVDTPRREARTGQMFMIGGLSIADKRKGLAVSAFCETHQRWKTMSRRRFELHHHAAVFLMGKLYIIGGANCSSDKPNIFAKATNKVHSYDFSRKKWRANSSMISNRVYHSAVAHEESIYVIGGEDSADRYPDAIEMYSSSTCSWHIIAQLLGGGRIGAGAAVCNNRLFVVGGYNPNRKNYILKDVLSLNLDSYSWEVHCPMPFPRCHAVLACVDQDLFLIGGLTQPTEINNIIQAPESVDSMHRFDEQTENWTFETVIPTPLHDAVGIVNGNKIYIMGGMKTPENVPLRQVYSFDVENCDWTVEDFVIPRAMVGASAAVLYH